MVVTIPSYAHHLLVQLIDHPLTHCLQAVGQLVGAAYGTHIRSLSPAIPALVGGVARPGHLGIPPENGMDALHAGGKG